MLKEFKTIHDEIVLPREIGGERVVMPSTDFAKLVNTTIPNYGFELTKLQVGEDGGSFCIFHEYRSQTNPLQINYNRFMILPENGLGPCSEKGDGGDFNQKDVVKTSKEFYCVPSNKAVDQVKDSSRGNEYLTIDFPSSNFMHIGFQKGRLKFEINSDIPEFLLYLNQLGILTVPTGNRNSSSRYIGGFPFSEKNIKKNLESMCEIFKYKRT